MTQPQGDNVAGVSRSTFVTVLAWIFIIGSAFSTLMSLLQSLVFGSMQGQFDAAFRDTTFTTQTPASFKFFVGHFELIILVMLVLSVASLVSSIGLLQRRNWARLLFIGVLVVGILWCVGGLFFQQSMMSGFRLPATHDAQAQAFEQQWQSTLRTMRVFMAVLSIGMAALLGWIVARLSSARIRAEFRSQARAA